MIEIRAATGSGEMKACVDLQIETWGYDASDVIPRKLFMVAQRIGGQVIGAFDAEIGIIEPGKGAESLVGFAMSLPGVKKTAAGPKTYLHSHMLAVREHWRNRGLGAQLKREQRREALERGITRMEWTFDPLEVKNAFLNIHRLGVIVREYRVDFYGVSSSRLQGGLPTDRLLAEWQLDSERVNATLDGSVPADGKIEDRILVPASIDQWKASEDTRERALAVQLENRRRFQQAFSRGLAVLGFVRDREGNGIFELGPLTGAEEGSNSGEPRNL
jgi:predicted GNAT superfamily acetyltransferase